MAHDPLSASGNGSDDVDGDELASSAQPGGRDTPPEPPVTLGPYRTAWRRFRKPERPIPPILMVAAACVVLGIGLYLFRGRGSGRASLSDVPPVLIDLIGVFPPPEEDLPPATPLAPLLVADAPEALAVLAPREGATRVRRGDVLQVRFNRPMVRGSEVGRPLADPPAILQPSVPGTWRWNTRSTLVFVPAPEAFARNRESQLTFREGTRSLDGEELWDDTPRVIVFDGTPRLVTHSRRVSTGEPLALFFDARVSAAEFGREILVWELAGQRPVPVRVTAVGFEAAEHPDAAPRFRVELVPQRALEAGARIAVAMAPRWGPYPTTYPHQVDFTLAPRPRFTGVGCEIGEWGSARCAFDADPGEIVDIGPTLGLLASHALASVGPGDVRITPPLRGMTVALGGEGREARRLVIIGGEWEPDQVYEVRLGPLSTANEERVVPLAPLAVRSRGHVPAVEIPTGAFAYERGAPIRMRVRGIHVDAGRAVVRAVPEGREVEAMLSPASFALGSDDAAWEPSATVPLPAILPSARPNRWGRGVLDARALARGAEMMVVALQADANDDRDAVQASFVQSTDLGVTAEALERGVLVWVSSLAHGGPVADAQVELRTPEGRLLASARTDADGAAWFRSDGRHGATLEWDPMQQTTMVVARSNGDRAVVRLDSRSAVGPEALGVSSAGESGGGGPQVRATVIADRGAYRPGERMSVLAFARVVDGARAVLPTDRAVRFVLRGDGAVPIAEARARLTRGRADAEWTLPEGTPLGNRVLELVAEDETVLGTTEVSIAEFRQPNFRVDLRTPEGDLHDGDVIRVTAGARYLFGAPLEGRPVHWSVVREGRAAYPSRWEGYAFGPLALGARSDTLAEGELTLDARGEAVLASPMVLAARARTRIWIEAEVTDTNGETVAASRPVTVYPALFEVGVRRLPAWIPHGTPLEIEAIAIDHRGELLSDRMIEARIVREGWHSWWEWQDQDAANEDDGGFRLRRSQQREIVHTCRVVSRAETGAPQCTFEPSRSGTYVIEAEARDERGRSTIAQTRVYVAGPDETPDRDPPGAPIALTPSRETWTLGQEAEIAFESPWPDAEALISVHHGSLLTRERRRVGAGGQIVRIPLTDDMVPNVFVTVALVRARSGEPAPGDRIDRHAPDLRFGATVLDVRPPSALLDVRIEAQTRGRPGERVPVVVRVRDEINGAPVRGAQVALWAVDEGTLRLTGYATPSPTAGLFAPRGGRFALEDLRRSLVSRVDPLVEAETSGDGGWRGYGVGPDALEIRERFDPTPLWAPRLVTAADGTAGAELVLPERPTEYRIMAVAIDDGLRSGRASSSIVVEQSLIVRPALPRFATEGDRFEAVAFVHNRGDQPIEAEIGAQIGGRERERRSVVVPAQGEVRIAEPVEVPVSSLAPLAIRFEARAGSGAEVWTHAVERTIPIVPAARWVRRRAVVGGTSEQAIELAFARGGASSPRGQLRITVASHPFVGLDGALDALDESWWGGTEVEAARLLAIASYLRMSEGLRRGGRDEAELRARARRALDRLLRARASDGGFAQWSATGGSAPHETVFAARALAEAQAAGIEVPAGVREAVLDRIAAFMRTGSFGETFGPAGQESYALALRVLADAGRRAPGVDSLYEQREFATPTALGQLAMALPQGDRRRDTVLLLAVHRLFPELEIPAFTGAADSTRATAPPAISTSRDPVALATVLEAASRSEVGIRYLRRLTQELLRTGALKADGLGSPIEIAASLAAISTCAERFGDPGPIEPRLTIDGMPIEPTVRGSQGAIYEVPWARVAEGSHALLARVAGGDEPLFVALDARWAEPIGEAEHIARGRAVALHRVFETSAGTPIAPGSHVPLGAMIRVRLFLYVEEGRAERMVVRDPLGAGFDSVHTTFHTTPLDSVRNMLGLGSDDDAVDPRVYHAWRTLPYIEYETLEAHATTFYLSGLRAGLSELTYAVRATTPGTFVIPPAAIEALRDESFVGRSAAATLVVDP
jgi:uncharacterized protein YfaS (alpha-2-macroglobulin family)